MTKAIRPGTWYVPEGETVRLTVVGIRIGNDEARPLCFADGTALYLLAEIEEADSDGPLFLKQFGATDLMLAGLHPDELDPGQVVEIRRFEGGGYEVELDPDEVEDAADAM